MPAFRFSVFNLYSISFVTRPGELPALSQCPCPAFNTYTYIVISHPDQRPPPTEFILGTNATVCLAPTSVAWFLDKSGKRAYYVCFNTDPVTICLNIKDPSEIKI